MLTAPAAFLLLLLLLLVSPLVPAVARWLTGDWQGPAGADIFIVLSAEQLGDGTIGLSSYWRSVYAVRHWRQVHPRLIVISGGRLAGPSQPAVSTVMADFLAAHGVPRDHLRAEDASFSTRENAVRTAALLAGQPGRKILITSDCHMRRAHRAFRRAGLDVVPVPVPDIGKRWNSWPERPACIYMVAVELCKTAYYSWRGWT